VPGPDQRLPDSSRPSGGSRRHALGTVVLMTLATVPMLAVVLAGSASLDTPAGPRTPFVASRPDLPVIVGPDDASTGPGSTAPTRGRGTPPAGDGCPGGPVGAQPCGYPMGGVSLDLGGVVIHFG